MSKKTETHDKAVEQKAAAHKAVAADSVHLKVLADLVTTEAMYVQGDVIEGSADEAQTLILNHAGYFEVVVHDQETE